MRNSSLVKGSCADNVTGLKPVAEAVALSDFIGGGVGERSLCTEATMEIVVERREVRMPA